MVRLRASKLSKLWQDSQRRVQVDIAALDIVSGHACALVAPSGAGKSTALSLLALAARADHVENYAIDEGSKQIDFTRAIKRKSSEVLTRLRGRHFAFAAQTDNLLPFLTCLENVELGQAFSKRRNRRDARAAMAAFGVDHVAQALPARASVGERHRVSLARALASNAPVLIADEPTAALDPTTADEALGVFMSHISQTGSVLLLATHDEALARRHGLELLAYAGQSSERAWHSTFSQVGAEAG